MGTSRPVPLNFLPGLSRDGTKLDSDRYYDAQWCRWRLGRPRKIGGYRQITDGLTGIPRRIHGFYIGGQTYFHIGHANGIQQVVIDSSGNLISVTDRTPAGFVANPNMGWTIDAIFDTASNNVTLVAHAVPDLVQLAVDVPANPYYGNITSGAALTAIPTALIAGGICCVQPYVFDFDSNGLVQWSPPNQPGQLGVISTPAGSGQARISAQKIVQGIALRGGGAQSPAALFWSLSELISATFVGGGPTWAFNTVSPSSSILSSDSIIEYDGLYFWAGVDRFLTFNGTVVEVPNQQNQDYFFDNLTPGFEAKTFAFKVPRYGEIWWCAPMFGNQEPSHAVIYNVRENCWYDTILPNTGRGAGLYAQGYNRPVMGGVTSDGTGYSLWSHEEGTDQVVSGVSTAILSYFETGILSGLKNTAPDGRALRVAEMEPDFTQSGPLDFTVYGSYGNARSQDVAGNTIQLQANANPADVSTQIAAFLEERRLLRFRISSDYTGGNYVAGRTMAHLEPTAERIMA